jgi:hypothetical protein
MELPYSVIAVIAQQPTHLLAAVVVVNANPRTVKGPLANCAGVLLLLQERLELSSRHVVLAAQVRTSLGFPVAF